MSVQTKSFVLLILLAGVLSVSLLYFSKHTKKYAETADMKTQNAENTKSERPTEQVAGQEVSTPPTDVANWEEYKDQKLKLSFKHPANWEVSTFKSTDPDYDIIVLDPGNNQDHLRIYAANDSYFASDGLKKDTAKVAGQEAWSVEDILFGVRSKSSYFTFDLGSNLNLKPTFKALMSTVAFNP